MQQAGAPGLDSAALVTIGHLLRERGYDFVTPTPETHARVLARSPGAARDLRDVFGWNRAFSADLFDAELRRAVERSSACVPLAGGLLRSRVRYSTLGDGLYVHSSYPTSDASSVFFGPDTYRYCAFLKRAVHRSERLVDVGCGSGAGGLCLSDVATTVVLADINPAALVLARVNAVLAGLSPDRASFVESDVLAGIDGAVDVVISNPPYLVDAQARTYRHGGGGHGTELALRILDESLARVSAGGRVLIYTGAPVVRGKDVFRENATTMLAKRGASFTYEELDPDVFGAELDNEAYADVERIAAIGLVATVP